MRRRFESWRDLLAGLLLAGALGAVSGCGPRMVVARGAPPAEQIENPGPPPHARAVWIPGHWAWRRGHYAWVGGHWEKKPRGNAWVPGHWRETPRGWEWVEGHWRR